MVQARWLVTLALWVVFPLSATHLMFPQVSSFQIFIPEKGTGTAISGFPPIGTVKARVSMTSNKQVTFTITPQFTPVDPAPTPLSISFTVKPGDPAPSPLDFTYPSIRPDKVSLVPPLLSDPPIYEIDLLVRSDFDVSCAAQQNARTFTVSVGATDPKITGVCLESFDSSSVSSCSTSVDSAFAVPIPASPPSNNFATVIGQPIPTRGCHLQRPPLDLVIVLDKSGSMISDTTSGIGCTTPPCKRMDALHFAVDTFVRRWSSLPAAADKIGAVLFTTTADWWSILSPGLSAFSSSGSTLSTNLDSTHCPNATTCGDLVPSFATSIGAGLLKANNSTNGLQSSGIIADGSRHVILLMTDGQQNTDPVVQGPGKGVIGPVMTQCIWNATPCGGGSTTTLPTPLVSLPNPPQFYTVTVGPSLGPTAAIQQAIDNATLGFYLNTEDNPGLLAPFFLELLQNFLKFNSYDTVRLISKATPYSTAVPISTTSYDVAFSLMWPKSMGVLRLSVIPPGGSKPIMQEDGSGFISIVQTLPLPTPFDPMGDWKILVETPTVAGVANTFKTSVTSGTAASGTTSGVPFDLHIMTDDAGIKADLSVVPSDYKPGDDIRLRAKLTRFGLPILGLGSHPGDQIEVQLVKPGQSIGDILSDSKASAVPPPCAPGAPCDQQSPAEAKLANTLKTNPSVLVHKSDTIQLFDDGNKAEHGDEVAGDGIYNALYPATLPGHYNFLFAVESTDPNTVRFSRQQLRTAYVRAVPEGDKTTFQTSIQPCTMTSVPVPGPSTTTKNAGRQACNTFVITMKPLTKFGNRMGPGWANYFWFTASGVTPFKAKDNLDGTYTATLNFTGNKPPTVSVGFEDALAVIGDSATYNELPAKPTVLVDHIPGATGKLAVFFEGGVGIPHGTFGSAFNPGFSLNAGLEYLVNAHFSAEGIFGYHHFPARIGSGLNVYQFSGNAKFYLRSPPNKVRPFVNGGIGGYHFSSGSTTAFGSNFGGGLLYEIGPHWGVQGSYNFHLVNTSIAATKFSTLQGGIRYVF